MAVILFDSLSEFQFMSNINTKVFEGLVITLICTFLVWYAQYHWNRRNLYIKAWQLRGPLTLPFIGNALYFVGSTSDILNNAIRIVSEFGTPVPVWLGNKLFFGISHAKDLEIILTSPHALAKDELYKYAEPVVGKGLFTASVPEWKRHRRIIMPTFNQKILDSFVEVFAEQTEIFLKQLESKVGKGTFNIFEIISRCTLDIICETAMDISVHAQTKDSDYVKWSNKGMEVIYRRMFNVLYHFDFIFRWTKLSNEMDDVLKKLHHFTDVVVKEKRQAYQKKLAEAKARPEALLDEDSRKRKSFLQQLIELSAEGANFTDKELRDEVDTFMIAGSDTTASMNSFVFVMLGMFPDVQQKVYEEVIGVLGHDRSVECKDLNAFPYLERVIKETMRVFPVGPLLVRAITKDIELEKCTLPAGSSVVLCIISLHRDPSVYPDPLKFDPDRFLPKEIAKRHPYSWLPFSGGPRNCVGPKYAFMAMKALIAMVVRKYRFSTEYKNIEDVKLKADLMLKPIDGYKVSLELREL